jgi:predicted metalloprotease with PDZ domain
MRYAQLAALPALATLVAATPVAAQVDREPEPAIAGPEWRAFALAQDERPHAALGITTVATGTARDTLGLLIERVMRGGPAEKAGLEEGSRLAAIGGVSLRASRSDVEDYAAAGTLARRLVRELEKVKPGEEVELRVYHDGRDQRVRVRTVSSDSLFRRTAFRRIGRAELDERPVLGIGIGGSASQRDSLGVLVVGVRDSSPAARAGIEEGNRIASIGGVDLRVAHADLGDPDAGRTKAQRLQREVARLEPGQTVRLRVYANGQWRDVALKVARAGDLPRPRNTMFFGLDESPMPDMPGMPDMPRVAPRPPLPPDGMREAPMRLELGPEFGERMRQVRAQLDRVRPELDRMRTEMPRMMRALPTPEIMRLHLDPARRGVTV